MANQNTSSGNRNDAERQSTDGQHPENGQRGRSKRGGEENGDRDRNRAITKRESDRWGAVPRQNWGWFGSTSPFSLMRRMAEDMDRIFDDYGMHRGGLGRTGAPSFTTGSETALGLLEPATRGTWMPPVEVFKRDDKLVVRADLPGLNKDQVKAEVDDGVLTISGERSDKREENRTDYYRGERSYGAFSRSIALPDGVNPDACEATFKDGVLEVTLQMPKEQANRKRQVEIK